jgi:hypothetical protein
MSRPKATAALSAHCASATANWPALSRKSQRPQPQQQFELPPEPTLADCGYERPNLRKRRLLGSVAGNRLKMPRPSKRHRAQVANREWQRDLEGYAAKRDALKLPDFEASAETVKTSL